MWLKMAFTNILIDYQGCIFWQKYVLHTYLEGDIQWEGEGGVIFYLLKSKPPTYPQVASYEVTLIYMYVYMKI